MSFIDFDIHQILCLQQFEKGDSKYKNKTLKEVLKEKEKELIEADHYDVLELSSDEEWEIEKVTPEEIVFKISKIVPDEEEDSDPAFEIVKKSKRSKKSHSRGRRQKNLAKELESSSEEEDESEGQEFQPKLDKTIEDNPNIQIPKGPFKMALRNRRFLLQIVLIFWCRYEYQRSWIIVDTKIESRWVPKIQGWTWPRIFQDPKLP